MSDSFLDQFIADLVKGASGNLRENGGVGVNIVIDRENHGREEKVASAPGGLAEARAQGARAAAATFGVKEAFLPALLSLAGSVAGPALARMGLGRLAAGAGGKMLGGLAGKVMPQIGGGLGRLGFDSLAGSVGGALGNRLGGGGQPGQQPYNPAMGAMGGAVGGRMLPQPPYGQQ